MKKIGVIGFGALGRQILGLLPDACAGGRVVVFDDIAHGQHRENSFSFDSFLDPKFADYDFYVALGYRHLARKAQILQDLRAAGRRVPSFVHASCHIHPTCRLGDGCLVYPLSNLD